MMWNDIVNANCARANTTASQPSNIGTTRRTFRRTPSLRKSALRFSRNASEAGAYLITPRCGLYPRRARNRRAALSRTRSIKPQSPGDLGLHGTGLVLADQHRAAELSSRVQPDRDHVVGAAPAAAF